MEILQKIENMSKPLASVIIPTYNMARFLPEAIKSVLDQTFSNFEIIVIDDGSTDNTEKVVSPFKNRLLYLSQPNKGESAARNLGIKRARGEFIAFLDADDIWFPKKLELQVQVLRDNTSIGMVGCGVIVVDESKNFLNKWVFRNFPNHDRLLKALSITQVIPGSSSGVLVRRKCFATVGYFDERIKIGPDWDMWLRIAKKFKIYFVEEPLIFIRKALNKPEFRTLTNEEHYVSMVIEKNIRGKVKQKAYANLYYRLGCSYLSASKKSEALKYIMRSIRQCPFLLFSKDFKKQNIPLADYRYYLLIKCICPNFLIELTKNFLNKNK